jgi:MoxR-like ATPase
MLLMGNQGVGKNKLTDKLLMLLHREREYIQLHRDTTVGTLTLLPSLRDGVVIFDDSPLVKAMIHGRVLVVDEFDKAPTEVVVVLKALLEDGEILLADGRRFVKEDSPMLSQNATSQNILSIHPKFLVIALANRPGSFGCCCRWLLPVVVRGCAGLCWVVLGCAGLCWVVLGCAGSDSFLLFLSLFRFSFFGKQFFS